jgi:hypothetical protein
LDDFLGKIEAELLDLRSSAEPGNEINPLHPSSEKIEAEPWDMRSQAEPGNEIKSESVAELLLC